MKRTEMAMRMPPSLCSCLWVSSLLRRSSVDFSAWPSETRKTITDLIKCRGTCSFFCWILSHLPLLRWADSLVRSAQLHLLPLLQRCCRCCSCSWAPFAWILNSGRSWPRWRSWRRRWWRRGWARWRWAWPRRGSTACTGGRCGGGSPQPLFEKAEKEILFGSSSWMPNSVPLLSLWRGPAWWWARRTLARWTRRRRWRWRGSANAWQRRTPGKKEFN